MARELRHLRRWLIILAILILLSIIAKPVVRTLESRWYRFVERGNRSPAMNSITIERTTAVYTAWGEGPVLVIWCDLAGNRSSPSLSGLGARPLGSLGYVAAGGRRMDWRCDSADGRTGSVLIHGCVLYDLARGNVFLVRTAGGRTRVDQLRRDLAKDRTMPENLAALAKEDAVVRAFVAEAASHE
jgi:hypothetical protein